MLSPLVRRPLGTSALGRAPLLSAELPTDSGRRVCRDKELAAVSIHEPDVAVLAEEFRLDEKDAELVLRENDGNLEKALRHCLASIHAQSTFPALYVSWSAATPSLERRMREEARPAIVVISRAVATAAYLLGIAMLIGFYGTNDGFELWERRTQQAQHPA